MGASLIFELKPLGSLGVALKSRLNQRRNVTRNKSQRRKAMGEIRLELMEQHRHGPNTHVGKLCKAASDEIWQLRKERDAFLAGITAICNAIPLLDLIQKTGGTEALADTFIAHINEVNSDPKGDI